MPGAVHVTDIQAGPGQFTQPPVGLAQSLRHIPAAATNIPARGAQATFRPPPRTASPRMLRSACPERREDCPRTLGDLMPSSRADTDTDTLTAFVRRSSLLSGTGRKLYLPVSDFHGQPGFSSLVRQVCRASRIRKPLFQKPNLPDLDRLDGFDG